jgi:hypothetical protein
VTGSSGVVLLTVVRGAQEGDAQPGDGGRVALARRRRFGMALASGGDDEAALAAWWPDVGTSRLARRNVLLGVLAHEWLEVRLRDRHRFQDALRARASSTSSSGASARDPDRTRGRGGAASSDTCAWRRAVAPLEPLLDDPDGDVRHAAVRAVGLRRDGPRPPGRSCGRCSAAASAGADLEHVTALGRRHAAAARTTSSSSRTSAPCSPRRSGSRAIPAPARPSPCICPFGSGGAASAAAARLGAQPIPRWRRWSPPRCRTTHGHGASPRPPARSGRCTRAIALVRSGVPPGCRTRPGGVRANCAEALVGVAGPHGRADVLEAALASDEPLVVARERARAARRWSSSASAVEVAAA